MNYRYVEVRAVGDPGELSLDLARHLPCRLLSGRVCIIAERPSVLAAVLGKRWLIIVHEMEREYSCTMNPVRRRELARQVAYMKAAVFSSHPPKDALPPTQILILVPGSAIPKDCKTIYATDPLTPAEFRRLLYSVPENGVVVMYGEWTEEYAAAALPAVTE